MRKIYKYKCMMPVEVADILNLLTLQKTNNKCFLSAVWWHFPLCSFNVLCWATKHLVHQYIDGN